MFKDKNRYFGNFNLFGVGLIKKNNFIIQKEKNNIFLVIVLVISILIIGGLVYYTGGTTKVYAHLMYIPIFLFAMLYNKRGGLIGAILAGLVLGPWMPLDVKQGIQQEPINWIFRISFFIIIGLTVGYFMKKIKEDSRKIIDLYEIDIATNLPNINSLQRILTKTKNKDFTLFAIVIKNYDDIFYSLGYEGSNLFLNILKEKVYKLEIPKSQLFRLYGGRYYLKVDTVDVQEVEIIAKKILDICDIPIKVNHIEVYCNLHIGIALNNIGEKPDEIIRKSGIAMQWAIDNLEDFCYFDESIEAIYRENFSILQNFRKAFINKELYVYYQPKISYKTGEVAGFEALIRWKHENVFISPAAFIPLIEKTTLIDSLTLFVLKNVFKKLVCWKNDGKTQSISVNISARNIENDIVMEYIERKIKDLEIDSKKLILEITETSIINDYKKVNKALERLKNLGVRIAIDDFGTGYTNWIYFSQLPVDFIKICNSFVKQLDNEKNQILVRKLIELCNALDIEVVAEGIETKEIEDLVKKLGFDYGQGYYYSRPFPEDELQNWVKVDRISKEKQRIC